jgi:hypothetical protein
MQQGTIHGKHQVRGQPSICITNCAECDSARRRRSRRDDAGCYHPRQRALDCPHQSTNDVGFRPFLTCSIAVCDNDGGGAPEAVVIPPCNSAYTRQSKIPPDDRPPATGARISSERPRRRRAAEQRDELASPHMRHGSSSRPGVTTSNRRPLAVGLPDAQPGAGRPARPWGSTPIVPSRVLRQPTLRATPAGNRVIREPLKLESGRMSHDGKLLPPRLTRARNVTKPSRSVRNSARYSAVAFARSFSKARSMTRLRQRRIEHVGRAVRHKRERITGWAVLLAISFPQHSGFGIGRRCQDQRTTAPARGLSAWCALGGQ